MNTAISERVYFGLTVSLDGIMSDTAEHGEPRLLTQAKPLPHPWEEMGQAVVPALHALRNASTTRSKAQSSRRVWAQYDIGLLSSELLIGLKLIQGIGPRSRNPAIIGESNGGYKDTKRQLVGNEIGDCRCQFTC